MIGAGAGVVFDWEPTLTSAAELITARAAPTRDFDDDRRPTRDQRREEYFERMDAKAAARAELAAEREAGIWSEDAGSLGQQRRAPSARGQRRPSDASDCSAADATRDGPVGANASS